MVAELHDRQPADAEQFVLAHLKALATPGVDWELQMATKRWATGMQMPYRWASRVAGDEDEISDYPIVRVHTLAKTYSEAKREARNTHRRMLILVHNPLFEVVMPDGRIAALEYCETTEGPHEEPYAAESVATRFVSEYRLALSSVAV